MDSSQSRDKRFTCDFSLSIKIGQQLHIVIHNAPYMLKLIMLSIIVLQQNDLSVMDFSDRTDRVKSNIFRIS